MATKKKWPNCLLIINKINRIYYSTSTLLFSKKGTKALSRIGPHDIEVLSVLICGLLGDWWGDKINNKVGPASVRFSIEQGEKNSAYIHHLTYLFFHWGYSSFIVPKLVKKANFSDNYSERFNYRLTLFTFSSLNWVYDSFYTINKGKKIKIVPFWIKEYITPIGLAHWIMQDGSKQAGQGINIATNAFSYEECVFLSQILNKKYNLVSTVIKTGYENQWKIAIWKESMPILVNIIKPYIIEEMKYKFNGYI
jgi:hypothetical protein